MREILFRGKCMDNGEWFEGSFLKDGEECKPARLEDLPFSDCYIVPKTNRDIIFACLLKGMSLRIEAMHVIPDTVGQYTGLTDKNGKRIFEGDIIRCGGKVVGVVNYHDCCFCVRFIMKDHANRSNPAMDIIENEYPNDIEVIGNIHDHPELIAEVER